MSSGAYEKFDLPAFLTHSRLAADNRSAHNLILNACWQLSQSKEKLLASAGVQDVFAQQIEPNAAHGWHLNKPAAKLWSSPKPFPIRRTGKTGKNRPQATGYNAKTTVNI